MVAVKEAEKPHRSKPSSSTSGLIRPTKWSAREASRQKMQLVKLKERNMKEEKEAAAKAKNDARIDRQQKKAEKERLEMMGRKVSSVHAVRRKYS